MPHDTSTSGSPEIDKIIQGLVGPRPDTTKSPGQLFPTLLLGALGGGGAAQTYINSRTNKQAADRYDATALQLYDYATKRVPLIKKEFTGPAGEVPTDQDAYEILKGELGVKPYGGPFSLDQTIRDQAKASLQATEQANLNTRVQQVLATGQLDVKQLTDTDPEVAAIAIPIARSRGGKLEKSTVTDRNDPRYGQEARTGRLSFRTPEQQDNWLAEQLAASRAANKPTLGDVTEADRFAYQKTRDQLQDFDEQMKRRDVALTALSGSDNKIDQLLERMTAVQAGQIDPVTQAPPDVALAQMRQQTNEEKFRLASSLSSIQQIVNPPELQQLVASLDLDNLSDDELRQKIYDFQAARYPLAAKDQKRKDRIGQLVDDYFSLFDYLSKLEELERRFEGR